MGKVWGISGFAVIFVLSVAGALPAQDAEWANVSHEIVGGYCVEIDTAQPQSVYFGTGKGLYKTEDGGANWKNILRDQRMVINHIAFGDTDTKHVYAATSKGIYASTDEGRTWKNIYRGTRENGSDCRIIVSRGGALYAGTGQGLLSSIDAGAHWSREAGTLGTERILAIAVENAAAGYQYAAAAGGVYRRRNEGGAWEKMFVVNPADNDENGAAAGAADDDAESAEQNCFLSDIVVDPDRPGMVFLATARGVQESNDSALTWHALTGAGLPDQDVRILKTGNGAMLYAVTKSDIRVYQAGQWHRLCSPVPASEIRGAAFAGDTVYAACDSGLFRLENKYDPPEPAADGRGRIYTKILPEVSSVQKAAIAYADVDMAKIREWRRQARHKALLPSVGMGINRDTADLRHWEGGSTTKDCDDILRKGKDSYEWDVSLTWDLGDLIWNDAQTSIDSRARLLVQLRADILDEVTKLYFEFVRTRTDIDSLSFLDKQKMSDKEIRLQELAAQLDGLTDGFFTRNSH